MKNICCNRFTVLILAVCILFLCSCGFLSKLGDAAIPLKTSLEKIDSILGRSQGKKIEDITKLAAQGFISGINLDSIKVNNLLDSLLHHLGPLLNEQLSQIELDSLQSKISSLLNTVTSDKRISANIDSLLSTVISSIESKKIKIHVDPKINTQNLIHSLDTILMTLLQTKNSDSLSAFINNTLLRVAGGDGLDSLLNKVSKPISKIDSVTTGWKKNIKLLLGGLAGLILLGAAAYAWRKRTQYKSLSALLTKNIDNINNQQEYDLVVQRIKSEASQNKLNGVLEDLIKENQSQYQKKTVYKNKANTALKAISQLLQDDIEMKNKLLKATEKDVELNKFIKDNITK